MIKEKSCGALVFRRDESDGKLYIALIRHVHGRFFSFPKGHVEKGESEKMTAEREVFEETGIHIRIVEKFRETVHYSPKAGVKKTVVYFVAVTDKLDTVAQENEIAEVEWVSEDRAVSLLAHANDKRVLSLAIEYMDQKQNDHDD